MENAKPKIGMWMFIAAASSALTILALPLVSAAISVNAGSVSVTAKEEVGLAPTRGAYASTDAFDLTVPPSGLFATSTQVLLHVNGGGKAWASTGCAVNFNPPCQTEVFGRIRDIFGNGNGIPETISAACYSGSGCDSDPTGIGKSRATGADPDSPLDMLVTIEHGAFGFNSEWVDFEICGEANILIDSNGDGQWSGETPTYDFTSGVVCDAASIHVSST